MIRLLQQMAFKHLERMRVGRIPETLRASNRSRTVPVVRRTILTWAIFPVSTIRDVVLISASRITPTIRKTRGTKMLKSSSMNRKMKIGTALWWRLRNLDRRRPCPLAQVKRIAKPLAVNLGTFKTPVGKMTILRRTSRLIGTNSNTMLSLSLRRVTKLESRFRSLWVLIRV